MCSNKSFKAKSVKSTRRVMQNNSVSIFIFLTITIIFVCISGEINLLKEQQNASNPIIGDCNLEYNNMNISQVNDVINNDIQTLKLNCNDYISLVFNDVFFDDYTIKKDWLNTDTTIINGFTFINCNITSICYGEIRSSKYPNLINLKFYNTEIKTFVKKMFQNVELKSFSLTQLIPSIEFDFEFLSPSVVKLQIQCTLTLIGFKYLFGYSQEYAFLTHLDLSYNDLETLPENSVNAISMKSLYLQWNSLVSIHQNAFAQMPVLSLIDLRNNYLLTLPAGVFGINIAVLYISENPWECECSLDWLKRLYESAKTNDGIARCSNGKTFDKIDFCNQTILTTTAQSTTVSDFMVCNANISVNKKSISFFVQRITKNSVTVLFSEADLKEELDILWFNHHHFTKSTLVTSNLSNVYKINNLNPDTSYMVCIKSHRHVTVKSPLNCLSVTTLDDLNNQTWISNQNKSLFISLVLLYFALLILGTVPVTYFYIFFHPEVLRRNKQIIIVKPSLMKCVLTKTVPTKVDKKFLYDYVTNYPRSQMFRTLSDLSQNTEVSAISRIDEDNTEHVYESIDDLYSEAIYEKLPDSSKQ